MFLSFSNQKERRAYGSAFIELQYCRRKQSASIAQIMDVDSITNWADDSLYIYIDDSEQFLSAYAGILGDGVYANCSEGTVDICGMNYYANNKVKEIISRLELHKPFEYEILLAWLQSPENTNGFYLLGL